MGRLRNHRRHERKGRRLKKHYEMITTVWNDIYHIIVILLFRVFSLLSSCSVFGSICEFERKSLSEEQLEQRNSGLQSNPIQLGPTGSNRHQHIYIYIITTIKYNHILINLIPPYPISVCVVLFLSSCVRIELTFDWLTLTHQSNWRGTTSTDTSTIQFDELEQKY